MEESAPNKAGLLRYMGIVPKQLLCRFNDERRDRLATNGHFAPLRDDPVIVRRLPNVDNFVFVSCARLAGSI